MAWYRWPRLLAVLVLALSLGCRKGGDWHQVACIHPCDLASQLEVTIAGDELGPKLVVTEPCRLLSECAGPTCRKATVYLPGPPEQGPGKGPGCHLTAISAHGRTVEKDLPFQYTDSLCCAGYEFSAGWRVEITFPLADGGLDAAQDGGDAAATD